MFPVRSRDRANVQREIRCQGVVVVADLCGHLVDVGAAVSLLAEDE